MAENPFQTSVMRRFINQAVFDQYGADHLASELRKRAVPEHEIRRIVEELEADPTSEERRH